MDEKMSDFCGEIKIGNAFQNGGGKTWKHLCDFVLWCKVRIKRGEIKQGENIDSWRNKKTLKISH